MCRILSCLVSCYREARYWPGRYSLPNLVTAVGGTISRETVDLASSIRLSATCVGYKRHQSAPELSCRVLAFGSASSGKNSCPVPSSLSSKLCHSEHVLCIVSLACFAFCPTGRSWTLGFGKLPHLASNRHLECLTPRLA